MICPESPQKGVMQQNADGCHPTQSIKGGKMLLALHACLHFHVLMPPPEYGRNMQPPGNGLFVA